jgi:hypothetical protein
MSSRITSWPGLVSGLLVALALALLVSGGITAAQVAEGAGTGEGLAPSGPAEPSAPRPRAISGIAEDDDRMSYHYILGSHLMPRGSDITYDYGGDGCLYVTGGTVSRLAFPVNIPQGSEIKYVRIYYVDEAVEDVSLWLTRYRPHAEASDITQVNSTGSEGYGSAVSDELAEVVDYREWQYTLNYGWDNNDDTHQICGVRVAYLDPFTVSYLPVIER